MYMNQNLVEPHFHIQFLAFNIHEVIMMVYVHFFQIGDRHPYSQRVSYAPEMIFCAMSSILWRPFHKG